MKRFLYALIVLLCGALPASAQLPMTGAGKGTPGGGGGGGIALVVGQVANGQSSFGSSPATVTLPNNPTTGNLVVVCVNGGSGSGAMTVTDSNSNSYTASTKTPFSGSAGRYGIFYLPNAPANATKTLTIAVGTPGGIINGYAAEFSGANASPFESDQTQNFGGAGTTINTPSITSVNNGDLLLGCATGFNTITTANSPWTGISTVINQTYAEYYIQPTAGAQAVNFTQATSTNWDGFIAAFKR